VRLGMVTERGAVEGLPSDFNLQLCHHNPLNKPVMPVQAVLLVVLALFVCRYTGAMRAAYVMATTRGGLMVTKNKYSSYTQPNMLYLLSSERIRALGEGKAIVVDNVFDMDFARALARDVESIDDKERESRDILLGMQRTAMGIESVVI